MGWGVSNVDDICDGGRCGGETKGKGKNRFTGTDWARISRGSGSGAPAARVEMTMIGRKVMMMMMECMSVRGMLSSSDGVCGRCDKDKDSSGWRDCSVLRL